MDRNVCFFVFLFFVVLTARDFFYKWNESLDKTSQMNAADNGIKKEIPSMSLRSTQTGPTVKILYCYACGYQRAFEEYSKAINSKYPEISVIGSNYNPSFIKNQMAQLVYVLKLVVIALLLLNVNLFTYFGVATPNVWIWMTEHKLYACLMTFFLANIVESQLLFSGAFEISYNDVPIWSKLSTGRIPSYSEMFDMIDSQHKFYQNDLFSETIHGMPGQKL